MTDIILYDYPKSSASYRLRIALNLKNIPYKKHHINLLTKDHLSSEHRARNPQSLVPVLSIDGLILTQSLAIMEYLDEVFPSPALLPKNPIDRAKSRAMAMAIAMEIHPICNLSVAQHVTQITQDGDDAKIKWMQHFIHKGLVPFEDMLHEQKPKPFCFGTHAGIVECCLIPQLYNAHRWGVSIKKMPYIQKLEENCLTSEAFLRAHPDYMDTFTLENN